MAQVKLAEHQGVDAEGTATKRYGPKEACEIVMKTLSTEAFLNLPCCLSVITKIIWCFGNFSVNISADFI